jgi:hypothetical protein
VAAQQEGPPVTALLVLGAKPNPALPPTGSYDAVACANGSGWSAARAGLPRPTFTVMTALLTDGSEAGRLRLDSLAGLGTGDLVYYPRPAQGWRALLKPKLRRMRAHVLQRELAARDYRWERFVEHPNAWYRAKVQELCGDMPEVAARIAVKQPSSGLIAVVLGLADGRWRRVILSGFSFELTQAMGVDPEIARRGTAASAHRDTDVLILRRLVERGLPLVTTEPAVIAAAGLPPLAG